MNKFYVVLLFVIIPLALFAEDSTKVLEYSLKPALLNDQDEDKTSPGAEFSFSANYDFYKTEATSFRKSAFVRADLEGLWALEKELNPRSIRSEARLGWAINLFRPQKTEPGPVEDSVIITQKSFDYGRLNLGLNAGYETDQSGDNTNTTVGIELIYVFLQNRGWKALIPSVYTYFEWTKSNSSKLQDELKVNDENYLRFRLASSWKIPIGDYLPGFLQALETRAGVRYFVDFDRHKLIENADQDKAFYAAGALFYTFNQPLIKGTFSGMFFKVTDGRIPPAIEETTQYLFGVVLFER